MRFWLALTLWLGSSALNGGNSALHLAGWADRSAGQLLRRELRPAGASGVLLDWSTGRVLAREGSGPPASPGSLLKPLLLAYALKHGLVSADTRVYCRRSLRVAGRSLACTHPGDQPLLDAEGALAESCNTWFASLATHMRAQDLDEVLRQAGLTHDAGRFQERDARVLTALGLENVEAEPMQIAVAYRSLLMGEGQTSVVWKGLRDSVMYGMANHARVTGVEVLGKTGTASNRGEWLTHGWFAGGVPGRFVLVIYLPHGDGGATSSLAGAVLQEMIKGTVL